MKQIKSILILCVLCASVAGMPGCATAPTTQTPAQQAATIQRLSYAAASIGTQAALIANPAYRPAFDLAYQNLDVLVTTGSVTGTGLRTILNSLPVQQLKSPEATLAISSATVLFDSIAGTSVSLTNNIYVTAAATGIHDGMKVALGK